MKTAQPAFGDLLVCHAQQWFVCQFPWDHEPVNDRRIDLLMPAPATAPHDGGALFPDGSGDRKSGHATAYVSRPYLGSRGPVGNGIVAATTARADERVHYPPHTVHYPPHTVPYQPAPTLPQGPTNPAFRTKGQLAAHLVARARAARIAFRALVADCLYGPSKSPHFIAELDRAATPYVVADEPNTPLMTKTGESPHTVADHPADAMHLPLPSGPLTPCHPPLPRCRAPDNCPLPPADMAGIVRCTGCAAGPSKIANTSSANWPGPTRLPGPLRPSDPTPLDAGRRSLRLLLAPTPHQRAPVVSDLARAGAVSMSITLAKGIGISLHLPP
ncbi:transposase [Streptomyces inhibens]|uniref:transposase n=1 Tax=Streptomyces inhibens TaxID=2293571 RepID=UPI0015F27F80|nr:transposase [Streptomyces inhibens]